MVHMNYIMHKYFGQTLSALGLLLLFIMPGIPLNAQLNVSSNGSASQLAQALVGQGVTVSNATLNCSSGSSGTFSIGSTNTIGLTSGIALTSGNATQLPGTAASLMSAQKCTGCNDADLSAIINNTTRDACKLEFDVVPIFDTLIFQYVFGSEEYHTYVCSNYNDVFGFFISGPGINGPYSNNSRNIALLPGTTTAVSISNVNHGFPPSPPNPPNSNCPPTNPAYFVNNQTNTNQITALNGYTVVLTAKIRVIPCQTYHLKLAVADAVDQIYDSGVFIGGGSLSSSGVTMSTSTSVAGFSNLIEGCVNGKFEFTRSVVDSTSLVIKYAIGGTATNGVDYPSIIDSVIILPNQASAYVNINPISDGVFEGTESVILYIREPCSGNIIDSAFLYIQDSIFLNTTPSQVICSGDSLQLNASGGLNYQWSPAAGLSNPNIANPVAYPSATTTYTVSTNVGTCSKSSTVTITVAQPPNVNAEPDTLICNGQVVQLLGSVPGGVAYSWSPGTGIINPNLPNPLAAPSSTTVYTLTVTDANGCSGTDQVTITVSPAPTISAGPDVSICAGDSVMLNGSGGIAYSWSPSTGLSDPLISSPVANPTTTTVYTLTGYGPNGCFANDIVVVTVNQLPLANAGPDVSICEGDSSILIGSGGITYSWNPSASLSCGGCQNPVAGPVVSTNYTLTVTDIFGCVNSDSVLVTVLPNPITLATPADTTVCPGESVQINSSGGVAYSWNPTAGLSASNISNPIATVTNSVDYVVTITGNNNCTATDTVSIQTHPPTIANAGIDDTICTGDATQLNASGGVTYSWSPAAGLSNTLINNPVANPNVTTNYSVLVTDANGCQSSDNMLLTVHQLPLVNAGPNQSACLGTPVQLSASGGVSYSWTPTSGLNNPNIANPVATPAITTTYTVVVTDANNCSNIDSVKVTIFSLPVASVSPADTSVCPGQSVLLQASGAASYSWSPTAGLNNPFGAITMATPALSTDYVVTVTDGNGCTDTDTARITVHPPAIANAGPDVSICIGNSTNLAGSGGVIYNWSPSGSLSNSSVPNPSANPISTTSYTLQVTDVNGCQDIDVVNVTVNALPIVSAGNDITVCQGTVVNLSASGAINYSWQPSTGLSCTICSSPAAIPSSTTTYTVTGTDANGCSSSDMVTITVNPLPAITVSPKDTAICPGFSVQLSGSGGIVYQWTPTTGLINPATPNPLATPTSSTDYVLTITDANNCSNTDTSHITVHPPAVANAGSDNTICLKNTAQLNASGGISYSWSPPTGLNNPNIGNPIASPPITTNYTVTVTDANGCKDTDDLILTVTPLPTADAGKDTTVCVGQVVQLNGLGGLGYIWSPATGLSCTTCQNPSTIASTTMNYILTAIDNKGCTDKDTMTLFVNPLPVVDAGKDTAICVNTSAQLTATGAVSYVWTPSAGLNNPNIPNPVSTPISQTTYTVTGIGANGCSNTDDITVSIHPVIQVDAGPDIGFCEGNGVQLNASGVSQYTWTPSIGLSNTGISNPVASPLSTTIYTVIGTDSNGCTTTDQVQVTVSTTPAVSLSQQDTSICKGSTLQLGASGGVSYSWLPATGLSNNAIANPIATPTTPTVYTVTITDINNCQNSATVAVGFYPAADPNAEPDLSEICSGDMVQLSAQNGVSYSWSPTNGLSDPLSATPLASPLTTTAYTVTIVDSYSCTYSDQLEVRVFPPATASAGLDKTIWHGDAVELDGSGNGSFLWSPAIDLSNPYIPNPMAAPDSTTIFTLEITTIDGCKAWDDMLVTVYYATKMYMPSAFSPNNDGYNDVFKATSFHEFELVYLKIFNRWGQMVFETTDTNTGWDGTFNGHNQPIGTYVYVLRGIGNRGEPFFYEGNFTLIR